MPRKFGAEQTALLKIVQGDIPHTLTPYADMAAEAGMTEIEVLSFLDELKEQGAIRRFGASLRHNKAGWNHNAMTAWEASEEEAELYGPIAARHPAVSHAYYRPSSAPDWPYTLYAMIHGRSEADCQSVIDELLVAWPLKHYAVLRSLRELKKSSMIYFE